MKKDDAGPVPIGILEKPKKMKKIKVKNQQGGLDTSNDPN